MKIISFYSDPDSATTYYSRCAYSFKRQCVQLSLDPFIEKLTSAGDYFSNTKMKPLFILNCMNKFNDSVLWMDIDTLWLNRPNLSKEVLDSDIGVIKKPRKESIPFYASTLYFNNNEVARSVLNQWIDECSKSDKHVGDHSIFGRIIAERGDHLKLSFIPNHFCHYRISPVIMVKSKLK